jgi:hypothetical protein
MSPGDGDARLFECDDCGALSVGSGRTSCCGSPMARVTPVAGDGHDGPSAVRDPPETAMHVCSERSPPGILR